MADEILSIEESTLNSIAQAIKNKGGTNTPLSFPDGMVSALQAIETEATVTPKITPQQVTLTPSSTSFAISPGFHDGTGTVKIETEAGSANPTSSERTYYPSAGKFFSSFLVGGIGSGYKVETGTKQGDGSKSLTIDGFDFTPIGIIGGVCAKSSNTSGQVADFAYLNNVSHSREGFYYYSSSKIMYHRTKSAADSDFKFSYGKVEINLQSTSYKFANTLWYVIWGS